MSPVPVITCFSIMGIIFLAIGGLLYHFNNSINEYEFDYSSDEACVSSSLCEINITINSDTPLRAPVYMYYKLTNYYQNHRRYVTSRSDSQLSGDYVNSYSSIQDCKPYESLENSREEEDMYLPCGLIASSQFSDVIRLFESDGSAAVPLKKEGIAWESDLNKKFNNPPAEASNQIRLIPDFKDEDFIVWMRTAGLPTFRKLYRIIEQDLEGNYYFRIENNFEVSSFKGTKSIVLSEISIFGGKNIFLAYTYFSVGATCILLAIIFGIKHSINGRQQGDISYLNW
eukprot:TRINITY_DN427_c0_g1_i4.p1 TRINITY_DN427_c0_g1~~TRINITY_DN427_c0_g1_i4.p1  ORF type:complete len:285 (+),score=33.87 TRINITY_DN427_c0_g1_i4:275-1129(+)